MVGILRFLPIAVLAILLAAAPLGYWIWRAHPGLGWGQWWQQVHGAVAEMGVGLLLICLLGRLGRPGHGLAWLVGMVLGLAEGVQFLHLYYAGLPLGEAALAHVDQLSLVISSDSLSKALVLIWIPALLLGAWRWGCRSVGSTGLMALGVLLAVVALSGHVGRQGRDSLEVHWPALEVIRSLVRHFASPVSVGGMEPFDLALARRFGFDLLDREGRLHARSRMFNVSMPWPRRSAMSRRRPNLIVFFIESLSARMVGAYGLRPYSVTPHLDAFARSATRVDGYVNHTTPTVPGLFGQLCSLYPPFQAEMDGVRPDRPMMCLPRLLAQQGYFTAYLTHSSPHYAHLGELAKAWGFQERYMKRRLLLRYLDGEAPYLGLGGLSDHQVMRALVRFMKRESARLERKPFFLAVSTVGTHTGRTLNPVDGVPPLPGHEDPVNAVFHDMDHAFGQFMAWFRHSPWADNTIVVVTGDHVLFPSLPYRAVAGEGYVPSVWDDLTLLIHDPFHRLPARLRVCGSSLDLAPTLWQLLDLPAQQRNGFMGRSLLGDRQRTLGTVSRSAYPEFGTLVRDAAGRRWRRPGDCRWTVDLHCPRDRALTALVAHLQQQVRAGADPGLWPRQGGKIAPARPLQPATR